MTNDLWLKTSIMAKRGLAKGQAGKRHELSIAAQGAFHYVYGPYAKPVLTINPGDVVVVETEDAFGGVITSEKDSPSAKLRFPFLNPQCGPIAVNDPPRVSQMVAPSVASCEPTPVVAGAFALAAQLPVVAFGVYTAKLLLLPRVA